LNFVPKNYLVVKIFRQTRENLVCPGKTKIDPLTREAKFDSGEKAKHSSNIQSSVSPVSPVRRFKKLRHLDRIGTQIEVII